MDMSTSDSRSTKMSYIASLTEAGPQQFSVLSFTGLNVLTEIDEIGSTNFLDSGLTVAAAKTRIQRFLRCKRYTICQILVGPHVQAWLSWSERGNVNP